MSAPIINGLRMNARRLDKFKARKCLQCDNRALSDDMFCAGCAQTPYCPRELPVYTPSPYKSTRNSRGDWL